MVHLVALIENIRHHLWRGSIDDRRAGDVWHVSVILILRYVELLVRIELTDSGKVYVASQYGHSNRLGRSDMLQLTNKPIALVLVVLSCPMVVKVVQNFNTAVKLVDKVS
jgi:hypothetical protein